MQYWYAWVTRLFVRTRRKSKFTRWRQLFELRPRDKNRWKLTWLLRFDVIEQKALGQRRRI